MQEPSYLGGIALVSIWFRMILTPKKIWVYKVSLTLTYPPNINIPLLFQFWYPWVGSLIPLMRLITDTMHSPIFQTNTGVHFKKIMDYLEQWVPPNPHSQGTRRQCRLLHSAHSLPPLAFYWACLSLGFQQDFCHCKMPALEVVQFFSPFSWVAWRTQNKIRPKKCEHDICPRGALLGKLVNMVR